MHGAPGRLFFPQRDMQYALPFCALAGMILY